MRKIKDFTSQQITDYMIRLSDIYREADWNLLEIEELKLFVDYKIPSPPQEFEDRLERFKYE